MVDDTILRAGNNIAELAHYGRMRPSLVLRHVLKHSHEVFWFYSKLTIEIGVQKQLNKWVVVPQQQLEQLAYRGIDELEFKVGKSPRSSYLCLTGAVSIYGGGTIAISGWEGTILRYDLLYLSEKDSKTFLSTLKTPNSNNPEATPKSEDWPWILAAANAMKEASPSSPLWHGISANLGHLAKHLVKDQKEFETIANLDPRKVDSLRRMLGSTRSHWEPKKKD